jgi:hypothetical protein
MTEDEFNERLKRTGFDRGVFDKAAKFFPQIWRWWEEEIEAVARDRGIRAALVFGMIVPAAAARPHHRHELGEALNAWLITSRPHCAYSVEPAATSDLLAGEFPKPLSLRFFQATGSGTPGESRPLPDICDLEHGGRVTLREINLLLVRSALNANPDGTGDHRNAMIAAIGEPEFNRAEIVESLRAAVPADLVDEVMIAGRSWNEL